MPFFPVLGNHEYMTDDGAPYLSMHATPASNVPADGVERYYSFDWGDVHFIALDTNLMGSASEAAMLDWLDRDLKGTGKFWKIVYCHHLPYPTGHHLGDPTSAQVLVQVVPIVERDGVQLLLAGHEHAYERSFPLRNGQPVTSGPATVYVVSGGGGGDLQNVGRLPQVAVSIEAYNYVRVDVYGAMLRVRAVGVGGGELDRVVIPVPPDRVRGRK